MKKAKLDKYLDEVFGPAVINQSVEGCQLMLTGGGYFEQPVLVAVSEEECRRNIQKIKAALEAAIGEQIVLRFAMSLVRKAVTSIKYHQTTVNFVVLRTGDSWFVDYTPGPKRNPGFLMPNIDDRRITYVKTRGDAAMSVVVISSGTRWTDITKTMPSGIPWFTNEMIKWTGEKLYYDFSTNVDLISESPIRMIFYYDHINDVLIPLFIYSHGEINCYEQVKDSEVTYFIQPVVGLNCTPGPVKLPDRMADRIVVKRGEQERPIYYGTKKWKYYVLHGKGFMDTILKCEKSITDEQQTYLLSQFTSGKEGHIRIGQLHDIYDIEHIIQDKEYIVIDVDENGKPHLNYRAVGNNSTFVIPEGYSIRYMCRDALNEGKIIVIAPYSVSNVPKKMQDVYTMNPTINLDSRESLVPTISVVVWLDEVHTTQLVWRKGSVAPVFDALNQATGERISVLGKEACLFSIIGPGQEITTALVLNASTAGRVARIRDLFEFYQFPGSDGPTNNASYYVARIVITKESLANESTLIFAYSDSTNRLILIKEPITK